MTGNDRFFDYYYGRESEQFTFFRIPKLLITDSYFSSLSAEAKLLYGLLMDRMNLSRRNAWYDDLGRVFIMYPIREIQEDLCVGKNTACKLFKQLESVGLVERVRRGLALPDLIYVKNFASGERPGEPEYDLGDPSLSTTTQKENELASESTDGNGSIWNVHGKSSARSVDRKSSIRSTGRSESIRSADREHSSRSGDWKGIDRESSSRSGDWKGTDRESSGRNSDENGIDQESSGRNGDWKNMNRESSGQIVTREFYAVREPEAWVCDNIEPEASHGDSISVCNDVEKEREEPGDSRSLKNKSQTSGSLKSKPQAPGGLKSKPLASPDLTSLRFKNQTSGVPKSGTLRNKNDINNNYSNKSSSILHPSSEETGSVKIDGEETGREESKEETVTAEKTTGDTPDYSAGLSYPELVKAVKEKIDYDVLASDYGDREVSIFPQLIAEMLYKCRDGRQIVVGNNTYQPEILKARYLEVDLQHIRHIMFLMQEEHISPKFVRNYYVQALYDAPVTMDAYYARRVDHDMNCGLLAAGA